jgi:hypothetical protein
MPLRAQCHRPEAFIIFATRGCQPPRRGGGCCAPNPPWGLPADPVDAPSPLAGRLAHWQNRFGKILRFQPHWPALATLCIRFTKSALLLRTAGWKRLRTILSWTLANGIEAATAAIQKSRRLHHAHG